MPDSLLHLRDQLRAGETTSRALTEGYLQKIEEKNPELNAVLTVAAESALEQATAADEQLNAGGADDKPLLGIPIAIKDNICTEGLKTTCASRILENWTPPYNATVIEKLNAAGAVILAKTNLDEFAMGSSTENSAFKPTQNPTAPGTIPGGSSGGSASAVAADFCAGALGSDTGGSIRQPAACCGCVGMKPTYGRVSRYGLVAFGSSLDQIGPLSHTVSDAAAILQVIAGHDPLDSTSAEESVPDFQAAATKGEDGLAGLKLGLPKEYFGEGLDGEVEQTVRAAIDKLKEAGAELHQVELPHTQYAVATYYLCATAEASSNLARYDGIHYGTRSPNATNALEVYTKTRSEGFGDEVKRRIMLGTYALSAGFYDAYYLRALKVRTLIQQDFTKAFEKVDAIVGPVMPAPPFKIGEKSDDPLQMYLSDIFTISANLAGIPGMSVPAGMSSDGRPIALQILAPAFKEETLFTVGRSHEIQNTPRPT
jgi:aspartyl-tRNA(Asn)/glutamyl-tRNA(Gln) amidotransferase subunit A